jgi:hypothetical protein
LPRLPPRRGSRGRAGQPRSRRLYRAARDQPLGWCPSRNGSIVVGIPPRGDPFPIPTPHDPTAQRMLRGTATGHDSPPWLIVSNDRFRVASHPPNQVPSVRFSRLGTAKVTHTNAGVSLRANSD